SGLIIDVRNGADAITLGQKAWIDGPRLGNNIAIGANIQLKSTCSLRSVLFGAAGYWNIRGIEIDCVPTASIRSAVVYLRQGFDVSSMERCLVRNFANTNGVLLDSLDAEFSYGVLFTNNWVDGQNNVG